MGQPVVVTRKPSSRPGVVRFELNRSLTGTGHELYRAGEVIAGDRPSDHLARRLFDTVGGIQSVHVMGGIVTLEVAFGADLDVAQEVIEDLYLYYLPGVEPPSAEELTA